MVPLVVMVALSLVACTYTAPESIPLDEVALLESSPDETKEIDIFIEDIEEDIEAKDSDGAKKNLKDIIKTAVKKGQLDRGFVSDLINSTLSGVQMGISIGSKNGTTNQLCIKLGNISMGGCRRTAVQVKDISSDHNRTQTLPEMDGS